MPWKECNQMNERLKFIARLLDGIGWRRSADRTCLKPNVRSYQRRFTSQKRTPHANSDCQQ